MYQGTPSCFPSTWPAALDPSEKSDMSRLSGTVENELEKSAIQVVPICARSGPLPAAMAVWSLSCAEDQGIAVTLTLTSGFSFSNPLTKSPSRSPSLPMAQMVRSPVALLESMVLTASESESALFADRPHADIPAIIATLAMPATTALKNGFLIEISFDSYQSNRLD